MTAGGKRSNAGRKPDPNKKIAVTKKLSVDIVAYLRTLENATEVIESAITRSKGFREWTKKRS